MIAMNRLLLAAFGCMLLIAGVTACKPFQHPWAMSQTPPPDFSLEVWVIAPWQGADDPLMTPSQYVVLPDRKLHAAIGPGATDKYFPPPTANLTHQQYAMLWSIIDTNGLMSFDGLDVQQAVTETQMIERIETPVERELQAMPGEIQGATPGVEEILEQDAERRVIDEAEKLDEATRIGEPLTEEIEPGRSGQPESPEPQILPVPVPQTEVQQPSLPSGVFEVTEDGLIPVERTNDPRMNLSFQIVDIAENVPTTEAVDDPNEPTLYRVNIRAYGEHHRYTTSPQASPATTQLVQMLAEYRGWTPVLRSDVDGETIETEVDAPLNR